MKKKGLIVATIVMVLVLAVSLTTATYAWFTTSASTSIDGFNLSVTAGNVMNIGLNNSTYTTYTAAASADSFDSGECVYTQDAAGQFAKGYWTGTTGLSATVGHDIQWSNQSKAVGFSTDENVATDASLATIGKTGFITKNSLAVIKANGTAQTSMTGQEFAYANRKSAATTDEGNGDYVYMWLGAQPTKLLVDDTNKLYVVVQVQGTGTTIGMASAIHVAYRVNAAIDGGEWTDVDVFDKSNTGATNDYHYNDSKETPTATIYGDYSSSKDIVGGTATKDNSTGLFSTTFPNAAVVEIDLSDYNAKSTSVPLDQIQLIIYIAGADEDCRDEAKAGKIGIGIFFGAQEYVAPTTPDPQG